MSEEHDEDFEDFEDFDDDEFDEDFGALHFSVGLF